MYKKVFVVFVLIIVFSLKTPAVLQSGPVLQIDEHEQFTTHGFSAMVWHNTYYEGRRGAIELVLHGTRIASNGDIRLAPIPIPDRYTVLIPEFKSRHVDQKKNTVTADVAYPQLGFTYQVHLTGVNDQLRIAVDIDGDIPDDIYGKLAFMLELFPGSYKGKTYFMDSKQGLFPQQFNGPRLQKNNALEAVPMAAGKKLSVAPEEKWLHFTVESKRGDLELLDGRASTNHKWYIIRSLIPKQKDKRVVEWIITPTIDENWLPDPVVGFSQIGYHVAQPKISVIEGHRQDNADSIFLKQVLPEGDIRTIKKTVPKQWGSYYQKNYRHFDFSDVQEEGMYFIEYRGRRTEVFPISSDLFATDFWRPSLVTFIPVQMCHVAVLDRIRLWHGACHLDDARQAPAKTRHFDHYEVIEEIQTGYESLEHIPHLNQGGWHDAGDVDIESTSNTSTISILCQIWEAFHPQIDQTYVDYDSQLVRIYRPDGKPDVLQQIVHGVQYVLGNYRAFGFLSRGVVSGDFQQYLLMGDAALKTDGFVYNSELKSNEVKNGQSGRNDDRLIFTNKGLYQEYQAGAALAAASRCLKDYDPALSAECLSTAAGIWETVNNWKGPEEEHRYYGRFQTVLKKQLAVELFLATDEETYRQAILEDTEITPRMIGRILWSLTRVIDRLDAPQSFLDTYHQSLHEYQKYFTDMMSKSPYGVPPIHTHFGTGIRFMNEANTYYYLHKKHPGIFNDAFLYHVAAYMHGNHPASNHSLVTGIGAKSITSAYGINRADHAYIPGGVCPGPLVIKPDLIEFRIDDPFFWVQKEYTIYGGAAYVFMMMALEDVALSE